MGYVSRKYLNEKWKSAKYDMEEFLQIGNDTISDRVPNEDVNVCIGNIKHQFNVIVSELEKYKY